MNANCSDFKEVINILKKSFVQKKKKKSGIYARYELLSRTLLAGETLKQCLQASLVQVKDCKFKKVTSQVYK